MNVLHRIFQSFFLRIVVAFRNIFRLTHTVETRLIEIQVTGCKQADKTKNNFLNGVLSINCHELFQSLSFPILEFPQTFHVKVSSLILRKLESLNQS